MTHLPRANQFSECITRRCTLRAVAKGAINLSQGFPEDEPDKSVLEAAATALLGGPNQYADMRGLPALRAAVASTLRKRAGMGWVDADRHVSIACGATEATAATLLALAGPGDDVVVQEPSYENYPPQVTIAGATVRWLCSSPPSWRLTSAALGAALTPRTRVLVLNNPNNPTGRVYSAAELRLVAEACIEHDLVAVVDEIYEHLVWSGQPMIPLASLPGMSERTVTISGISKTYRATGWRVGWAVAPEDITLALRRVHDFLTATVPTPLQAAAVAALELPPSYYEAQTTAYLGRRTLMAQFLKEAGLEFSEPEGAYYFFPRIKGERFRDSVEFADALLDEARVAVVPYTAFFPVGERGRLHFRINFAKRDGTIIEAGQRLVAFCRRNGT